MPHEFSGRGTLHSYTIIYQPPDRFDAASPYVVALIDLVEGERITAQLTDVTPKALELGISLEMVIREIYADGDSGPIMYGYKFRPLLRKI